MLKARSIRCGGWWVAAPVRCRLGPEWVQAGSSQEQHGAG
jgi:hypothetical protein